MSTFHLHLDFLPETLDAAGLSTPETAYQHMNGAFLSRYRVPTCLGKSTFARKSDLRNAAFVGCVGATYV